MRNGILISLYSLALAAGVVSAQDPQPQTDKPKDTPAIIGNPAQMPAAPAVTPGPIPALGGGCGCAAGPINWQDCGSGCGAAGSHWFDGGCGGCDSGCGSHFWASAEYMLTWMKNGPTPGPLVTSSTAPGNLGTSGALGQAGTTALYNPAGLDAGTFQSTRITIGGWVNADQTVGVEVSGFVTEQRSTHFGISSDGAGNPPIYVPAFDTARNAESALVVADPILKEAGSVLWASETRLWGIETNGIFASHSGSNYQVALLAGFRYVDLSESLEMANTTATLPIAAGQTTYTDSLVDHFQTRNQFYGGQLGAKASCSWNFLSLDAFGKLALGGTHSTVGTAGSITESATGPSPGTFPGGFLTQPSNIGSQSKDEFSVVPEIEVKLSCEIIPGLRAFVGYDFLYWSQVARPGDEVNRNLNLTQSPIFGSGTLTGAANPTPLFTRTDFWANSISFGLELHY